MTTTTTTTRRRFTRDDIETHKTGYYGPSLPAVNVKVWYQASEVDWRDDIALEFDWDADELDRFRDWLEEHHDRDPDAFSWAWEAACEEGWEMAQTDAHELFGPCQVSSEGRCGGWLVVDGLKDIDSWDAIDIAQWGKYVRWVEAIRDDTSRRYVWLLAANIWEIEKDDTEAQARDAVL